MCPKLVRESQVPDLNALQLYSRPQRLVYVLKNSFQFARVLSYICILRLCKL